jgi:hypothetical protein
MTSQHGAYALRAGLGRLYARMHKHAHTGQYEIIPAFTQQQWFRERASMLRCTYIVCVVCKTVASRGQDTSLTTPKTQLRYSLWWVETENIK